MLIGIIIGVFIMSACAFCAFVTFDDGQEEFSLFLCGPVAWIIVIIGSIIYSIYKSLRLWHFRTHYSSLLFMIDGQSWTTYYVRNELIDAFYTEEDNHPEYYVKEVQPCTSAKGLPFREHMINKNGFLRQYSGNGGDFICNFIRPYWDLYNKFNKRA